jgi:hypothetical protein
MTMAHLPGMPGHQARPSRIISYMMRRPGPSDVIAVVFAALLIPFYELIRAGNYWDRVIDWLDNPTFNWQVTMSEAMQAQFRRAPLPAVRKRAEARGRRHAHHCGAV